MSSPENEFSMFFDPADTQSINQTNNLFLQDSSLEKENKSG
jgi:hypothetical protein